MAASAPLHNILEKAASIRNRGVQPASPCGLTSSREHLLCPQACIRGQWGYLVSVMNTFVKNLRLFAHAGCLKAGQ